MPVQVAYFLIVLIDLILGSYSGWRCWYDNDEEILLKHVVLIVIVILLISFIPFFNIIAMLFMVWISLLDLWENDDPNVWFNKRLK